MAGARWFNPEDEMTWLRVDFYLALWYVTDGDMLGKLGEGLSCDKVWGIHNIDVNSVE